MSKKREIWVADCETDPFKIGRYPKPFIWGCRSEHEYHVFDSTAGFVDFIRQQHCIVYAHNGGKFDWHFIFDHLESYSELLVISGRVSKFVIGAAEFRDSQNILPFALAKWAKDDFDYRILEADVRDIPKNRSEIRQYLRSDCDNLYAVVTAFIDRYGRSLTLSGAALKFWQSLGSTTVPAPESTPGFYQDVAPYYYGGRVQVDRPGVSRGDFTLVDINSAYPDAMSHRHPYGQIRSISRDLPATGVERCMISVTCASTGALPWRDPDNKNALTFPSDKRTRRFDVTGWEFVVAQELGLMSVFEVNRVMRFVDDVSFADYVQHFFALKTNAKTRLDNDPGDQDAKADYLFAKYFLNTLYGKLASNPAEYSEYLVLPPHHLEAARVTGDYRFVAQLSQANALASRPLPAYLQRYLNVATAASITGFVRAKMARARHVCGGVLYSDTDSILASDVSALDLHPTRLGAWDVEAHVSMAAIAAKKLYAFKIADSDKYKTASRGVRLGAADIIRVARGDVVTYRAEAPTYSVAKGPHFLVRDVVSREDSTAALHRRCANQDLEVPEHLYSSNPI